MSGETLRDANVRKGRVTFWLFAVFGTCVLLFGVLFAQTPSTDHTVDVVIFGLATLLICMSLAVGIVQKRFRVSAAASIGGIVLAMESLVCVWLLVDMLTHLHTL